MFLKFWRKKRAYERIPICLDVTVHNAESPQNGLVTNLSENGMFFITGANLSPGLHIEVSITSKNDEITVPIKIIRIKKENIYDGFGAELTNAYQHYIDFVHSLKTLSFIPK